ncbi:MAG: hypothetical protein HOE12_19965 [Gammaproteobacteria bacterium]|jgi:hypothetical protein|nr:hypothetical protein [Gammaproteobacteria bacterium]
MNLEHAPWLFTPALFYVFIIVALLLVEIVKKTLIPKKWKIRTALLGLIPLFITLIIAVFSMAGEMLYLLPEYASRQQEIIQFVDTANGYNNNLLSMIPMGLVYFVVLSISQNKKFLFGENVNTRPKCNKYTGNLIDELKQNELNQQREDDEQISRLAADEADGIFT